MNASGDNSFAKQGVFGDSIDSLMHVDNSEFSDIDEPIMTRARTRSRSTAREPSQPPIEIEVKQKKPRTRKKDVIKRRPAIKEEPLTDDEDDVYYNSFI